MSALESFSTTALRPRQRVEFWDELCSGVAPVATEAADLNFFEPSCARGFAGDLELCELHSFPSTVHHTSAHVAQMRAPLYFLCFQIDGESVHRQDGREAHLRPGDFTLLATARPYQTVFPEPNRALCIALAEAALLRQMPSPQNAVAMRMSRQDSLVRMLGDFAVGLWRECRATTIERVGSSLSSALLHLLGSAYAGQAERTPQGSISLENRRFQILCFIEDHLREGTLGPARIATRFKMSLRSLHMLFSSAPETISRYILRRRLEESARALASPLHRARTVSDVAFDHGFSSSAHFCKVFREHFGTTPTEYRHAVAHPHRDTLRAG